MEGVGVEREQRQERYLTSDAASAQAAPWAATVRSTTGCATLLLMTRAAICRSTGSAAGTARGSPPDRSASEPFGDHGASTFKG